MRKESYKDQQFEPELRDDDSEYMNDNLKQQADKPQLSEKELNEDMPSKMLAPNNP